MSILLQRTADHLKIDRYQISDTFVPRSIRHSAVVQFMFPFGIDKITVVEKSKKRKYTAECSSHPELERIAEQLKQIVLEAVLIIDSPEISDDRMETLKQLGRNVKDLKNEIDNTECNPPDLSDSFGHCLTQFTTLIAKKHIFSRLKILQYIKTHIDLPPSLSLHDVQRCASRLNRNNKILSKYINRLFFSFQDDFHISTWRRIKVTLPCSHNKEWMTAFINKILDAQQIFIKFVILCAYVVSGATNHDAFQTFLSGLNDNELILVQYEEIFRSSLRQEKLFTA